MPHLRQAIPILDGLLSANLSRGGLTTREVQEAVVVTQVITRLSFSAGNDTVASSMRTKVLEVMNNVAEGATLGMALGQAESLVTSVGLLANTSMLEPPQQATAVSVLRATTAAVGETSDNLHAETLSALSIMVGEGILNKKDAARARVDVTVNEVLTNLAGLAVGKLTPMDEPMVYEDENFGKHWALETVARLRSLSHHSQDEC